MEKVVKIICLIFVAIGSIMLTIAGSFRNNTKTKQKRKMKVNDIASIYKYRKVMAFYRDFLKDFECVNTDIKSIKKGSFIQCNKN